MILNLKEFEKPSLFARGRHHAELLLGIDEQDAGSVGIGEHHATIAQDCQKIDDVEVGDERVGELKKRS